MKAINDADASGAELSAALARAAAIGRTFLSQHPHVCSLMSTSPGNARPPWRTAAD